MKKQFSVFQRKFFAKKKNVADYLAFKKPAGVKVKPYFLFAVVQKKTDQRKGVVFAVISPAALNGYIYGVLNILVGMNLGAQA